MVRQRWIEKRITDEVITDIGYYVQVGTNTPTFQSDGVQGKQVVWDVYEQFVLANGVLGISVAIARGLTLEQALSLLSLKWDN